MKNNFQLILVSIFGFFIILGVTSFSLYKARNSTENTVPVSIWGTVDSKTFESFINKLKVDYNKEITAKYTEKNLATIDAELVEAIASGVGPDIVLLPQSLILRYSDKVYPITYKTLSERVFKDTFVQGGELFLTTSGIIGLPFFIDPLVMYWNRDIFSDVGIAKPPTKWVEFANIANKISKIDNNANVIQSAAALGGYKNINNAKALVSTMIMQAGSPITKVQKGAISSALGDTPENNPEIKEVPAISAMRFYTEYSNPKKSVYSWNSSLPTSKQMFLSGDLAVYFGKASEISEIRAKNPNLNFDVAEIPQILDSKNKITYGDIYSFLILKSSQNPNGAFNAISTLVSADVVPVFLNFNNYAPARRDLIQKGIDDYAKTIFYNSALISKAWLDPQGYSTDIILQNMVDNITTGRESIESSVKKASQELDNLL